MTLICLASQKGSPGTTMTTLAVAAALQVADGRQKVMVEADCTGGTLAIRYQLPVEPGLLTLAAAVRGGVDAQSLWRHTQELPGGLQVVVCPDGPDQVHAAMSASGAALGRFLNQLGNVDVICDVGRLAPDSAALSFVAEASALLMVARPTAEQLQPAARRMMALRPQVDNIGWILVGEKPYGPTEIEATYKFPVVGVVADDPRAVARLEQGLMTKRLRRSPFVRSSATLATTLSSWLAPLQSAEADVAPVVSDPATPAPTRGGSVSRRAPVPTAPAVDGEAPPIPPDPEPTDGSIPLTGVPMPSAPVADPPHPGRDVIAAPPPPSPPSSGVSPPSSGVSPSPPSPSSDVPPSTERNDWPAPTALASNPAPVREPQSPSDRPSDPLLARDANGAAPAPPRAPGSSLPPAHDPPPASAPAVGPGVNGGGLGPGVNGTEADDVVDIDRLPPPPDGLEPLDPTPPSVLANGASADVAPPWPYGSPADPDRSAGSSPAHPEPAEPIVNGDSWETEIFTRTIDFEELLAPTAPAAEMPPATADSIAVEPEENGRSGRAEPPSPFPHEDQDDRGRR